MKAKKSKSLKLIQHAYDSKKAGMWDGDAEKQVIFTELYIRQKYSEQLHIVDYVKLKTYQFFKAYNERDIFEFGITDYNKNSDLIIFNKENLDNIQPYIELYKNTKKRYTFFPVSSYEGYNKNELLGHSVFFLYDKKLHTVTLIDSNGDELRHYQKDIKAFFELIYGENVTINYWIDCDCKNLGGLHYYKCSRGSKEDKYLYTSPGYCVIWTLWFLEMILTHPKLTIEQLKLKTITLLEKKRNLVCKIAISYAQFIEKITDKYETRVTKNKMEIKEKSTGKTYNITKTILKALGISSLTLLLASIFLVRSGLNVDTNHKPSMFNKLILDFYLFTSKRLNKARIE